MAGMIPRFAPESTAAFGPERAPAFGGIRICFDRSQDCGLNPEVCKMLGV